jgi:hypothetical protein
MALAEKVDLSRADPAQVALWRERASTALRATSEIIQRFGK